MPFTYLDNIPLEKAREDYLKFLSGKGFCCRRETVPTVDSADRVTAQAVYAAICAPHYPASAMDGIALRASVTFGASESSPVTLTREQFLVVDTGDPVPEGCDAVVMIEDVIRQPDGTVRLYTPAVPWQHVRQVGEDVCAGEMILGAYRRITPAAVGALLAGGVMEVEVIARPRVAIIPTGDEIVSPRADPKPGEIIEFNSAIFSGMLRQWDALPVTWEIIPDVYDRILDAVRKAAEECDIVLLNAGSSAGREDFSARALAEAGSVLYHGIAMRPGKPAILAGIGNVPALGVPGYPVSGILVLEQLLRPVLDAWYHRCPEPECQAEAILSRPVVSGLKYEEFVRVRVGRSGENLTATPLSRGSGVVTSFMKADGIVRIPQQLEGLEAGSRVPVRLLRSQEELNHTVLAIGSHDPLMDELADLLHRSNPALTLASSHVGSMGGIMAVRRGEAHLAGIHLLDETDGNYNLSYLRRYFPQGGVRLVECVGRVQGLMVAAGNPLGLQGVEDLQRKNMRYVNRQKGSGTRILIDHLCRKLQMDTGSIYGYDREEFTHTSVAAQIASGSGDAGMGIYSAAKLYGLDFIPVCMEQYDLLIPDTAWEHPGVQSLLELLAGPEFRARLTAMGGYELQHPGQVRARL